MRFLIFIIFISTSNGAFCQTRCPVGVQMGSIQCIPDTPEMQGQQLNPPKPLPNGEWVETWGAVAEGRENGDTGVSVGKLSRSEAEREAVARCQDWGGSCKPVLAYQNQCVAIVDGPESGHGGGAIARAGSKEKASDIALRLCKNKNNGVECNVNYTACSLPIFRKY